jgi:hypothetical protein
MPVPGRQLLPPLPLDEAMMWIGRMPNRTEIELPTAQRKLRHNDD